MSGLEVDRDKLRQKIQYIRDALRRLEEIRARGESAYLADSLLQAASIRYLQTGIEAMIDAANHIVARQGLGLPLTYAQALELLVREGILPRDRNAVYKEMVKFRNRAVHLYDEIDPGEVYRILENHLGDFEGFIQVIVQRFFEEGEAAPS